MVWLYTSKAKLDWLGGLVAVYCQKKIIKAGMLIVYMSGL